MEKDLMIELMLINGSISMERAEELIKAHIDEVESIWVNEAIYLHGAFEGAPGRHSLA